MNGERIRRRQFSLICSGVTAVGARGVVDDVASTIALIWWMTRRAPVDYVVEGVASTDTLSDYVVDGMGRGGGAALAGASCCHRCVKVVSEDGCGAGAYTGPLFSST